VVKIKHRGMVGSCDAIVIPGGESTTIVSGAIAERPKFITYVIYSVVICAVIYPIYGHWLWGGGWLSSADFMTALGGGYGALDFAGSGVVHAVGGYIALASCLLLGPRIGRYRKTESLYRYQGTVFRLQCLVLSSSGSADSASIQAARSLLTSCEYP
jgi:ammonia channel protein AmtB